jgi:Ca-activated chloride channel family protein
LHRLHIGTIGDLGTAIGDAIVVAAKRLKSVPNAKSRVIILLTDGDNNKGEIEPLPAAQLAAAVGSKIYTIGIGIEKPCYMPAFDPSTGKLKLDANGNIIPTLLLQPANYAVLGKMAELSHGQFFRATNRRELLNIYNQIDQLEKTEVKFRRYATYKPLFPWPLLAALGLLALELILVNTRYRRVP